MLRHMLRIVATCLLLLGTVPATAATKLIELEIGGRIALGDLVVPDGASLANGVVLLTHGTLAHKDMELIEALQNALAERGVVTLAHTLALGQDKREGMFDCAQPHVHAHEDAIAEISAWISWLKLNGAGTVTTLGHSRGGNQVAWFVADKGSVDKVVLMAPATGTSPQQAAETYKGRFTADLKPVLDKAAALVTAGKGDALVEVPGFIYCKGGKASANSIVSYYGDEPRRATQSLVPLIKSPMLVIAGSKDTVVPNVAEKIGPLADGEQVRLEIIEDAGHMFLDFHAEDAADLIAQFVNK